MSKKRTAPASATRVHQVRSQRVLATDIQPVVSAGVRPAKAVVGERVDVSAILFRDGHDAVGATLLIESPDGLLSTAEMHPTQEYDRWQGELRPDTQGRWRFTIEAWADPIATWRSRAAIKVPAGLDVELELAAGAQLISRAASAMPGPDATVVSAASAALLDEAVTADRRLVGLSDPDVLAALARFPLREHVSTYGPFPLHVERRRALVGSWYEFFPRSEGAHLDGTGQWVSGTFRTATPRLAAIADMGFDVVYLPPIHPIGSTFRKGPNNSVTAEPGDPGSPWAIGSPEGGHDAVHPELGTIGDFDDFVDAARDAGLEIALDLALQCAPDHPWVSTHPEWFVHRADGTIAYAENPPKKYQDIFPLNFDTDPDGIYAEVLRIVRHWMSHGVRIFRVDNPHTKPVPFWERLIDEINSTDPDVIFLAEAFTVPHMMRELAQVGFQQSYTYFTWRNSKSDLVSYGHELSHTASPYMRPNAFTNTPDILHEYLQAGGPAAFRIRATLAATMFPTYGVYSGFELYERVAVAAGSEEYLNSEKYQYRPRDWVKAEAAGQSLSGYLRMLNTIRREHPALQTLRGLTFHFVDDESMLCFSRRDGEDCVLVVCTVDPHQARESLVWLDLRELGIESDRLFDAHDLITGKTWGWGGSNFVRLDPRVEVAHIIHVRARSA